MELDGMYRAWFGDRIFPWWEVRPPSDHFNSCLRGDMSFDPFRSPVTGVVRKLSQQFARMEESHQPDGSNHKDNEHPETSDCGPHDLHAPERRQDHDRRV